MGIGGDERPDDNEKTKLVIISATGFLSRVHNRNKALPVSVVEHFLIAMTRSQNASALTIVLKMMLFSSISTNNTRSGEKPLVHTKCN
uniref:Uncharacterized protein n=1 Tax=Rhizophora mucronata TaxID=61149 RepID=A0A2P2PRW6_RHIMU